MLLLLSQFGCFHCCAHFTFFSLDSYKQNITHNQGYTYTREKAKVTALSICCIVSNLCVYTTATAWATKIKEKNRFRFRSWYKCSLRHKSRTTEYTCLIPLMQYIRFLFGAVSLTSVIKKVTVSREDADRTNHRQPMNKIIQNTQAGQYWSDTLHKLESVAITQQSYHEDRPLVVTSSR